MVKERHTTASRFLPPIHSDQTTPPATPFVGARLQSESDAESDGDQIRSSHAVRRSHTSLGQGDTRDRYSVAAVFERHRQWCVSMARHVSSRESARSGRGRKSLDSTPTQARVPYITPPSTAENAATRSRHSARKDSLMQTLAGEPVVDPIFDATFARRLKTVQVRNTDENVSAVQDKRAQLHVSKEVAREVEGRRREEYRRQVYEEHQKAHERKIQAERGVRGIHWLQHVAAAMLLVKWQRQLKVFHSFDTHRRLLLPMLVRRVLVKKRLSWRETFTNDRITENPRPTVDMLRGTGEGFFKGWTNAELHYFISLMSPCSFRQHQYMMFAGDYDRVMYIVTSGTVEVQIRNKGAGKRRNRDNSKCFPLKTPTYVGEFALLCKEPRGASIQCLEDVDAWRIERKDFERVLETLSPSIVEHLETVANARRRGNLLNYFPIRADALVRVEGFSGMSLDQLQEVVKEMRPDVIRAGTVVVSEGEYKPQVLVLTDGALELTNAAGQTRTLSKGDAYGITDTFFLGVLSSWTVRSRAGAEVWVLSREGLDNACTLFPGSLTDARRAIKSAWARDLVKLSHPPRFVLTDPYLRNTLLPSAIHTAWSEYAQPMVCMAGDTIYAADTTVTALYVLVSGSVILRHANGFTTHDDEITVDHALGGAYSARSLSSHTFTKLFPAVKHVLAPYMHPVESPLDPASAPFPAVRRVLVEDEAVAAREEEDVGILLGAFEFSSGKPQYICSVQCTSRCDIWRIDLKAFQLEVLPKVPWGTRAADCCHLLSDAFARLAVDELLDGPGFVRIHKHRLSAAYQESGEVGKGQGRKSPRRRLKGLRASPTTEPLEGTSRNSSPARSTNRGVLPAIHRR